MEVIIKMKVFVTFEKRWCNCHSELYSINSPRTYLGHRAINCANKKHLGWSFVIENSFLTCTSSSSVTSSHHNRLLLPSSTPPNISCHLGTSFSDNTETPTPLDMNRGFLSDAKAKTRLAGRGKIAKQLIN